MGLASLVQSCMWWQTASSLFYQRRFSVNELSASDSLSTTRPSDHSTVPWPGGKSEH